MKNLTKDAKQLIQHIQKTIKKMELPFFESQEMNRHYAKDGYRYVAREVMVQLTKNLEHYDKALNGSEGVSYGLRDIEAILKPLANGEALSTSQYTFLDEAMAKSEDKLKENEQNGKPRHFKDQLLLKIFWENHREEIKSAVVSSRSLGR